MDDERKAPIGTIFLLIGFLAGVVTCATLQPKSLSHGNCVILWNGLEITIEHPRHSTRSGVDKQGIKWYKRMVYHYGYLNHVGRDGEKTDVYVGPYLNSKKVFIITQNDHYTGQFDEYKIMIGFQNIEEAKEGYLMHYPDDWKGFGGIKEFDLQAFLDWL